MSRKFLLLLAFVCALPVARAQNADLPVLLSHVGRLLDAGDAPVTAVTAVELSLWDGAEARATRVWRETYSV